MKKTITILVAVCLSVILCACNDIPVAAKTIGTVEPLSVSVNGVYDENGAAWVATMDGNATEIKGLIKKAMISPDRKKAVFIENDGLYSINLKNGDKKQISTECRTIVELRDAGILYTRTDGVSIRHLFDTDKEFRLGYCDSVCVSEHSLNIAYTVDDKIFYLPENSEKRVDLGSYAEQVSFEKVSDDGGIVLWTDRSGAADNLMLYENGERSKIVAFDRGFFPFDNTWTEFDTSGDWLVAMNSGSGKMVLKKRGKEALILSLRGTVDDAYAFTKEGRFFEHPYNNDGLYVMAGDYGDTLYYVSPENEQEKLLAGISLVDISDEWVCYQKEDGGLYCAKLNKAEISEETRLATDASIIINRPSAGGFFYYRCDVDENGLGTLFVYHGGDSTAIEIDREVAETALFSPDGSTVLYFKDVEETRENGGNMGTLCSFHYGEETPTTISQSVLWGGINSGITSEHLKNNIFSHIYQNAVKPESFLYERFLESTDDTVLFDWMYFDGQQSIKLASSVSRSHF